MLHLLHGIRVVEIGQLLHGGGQLCTGSGIHLDRLMHQFHIDGDAAIVDLLVEVVFLPDRIRNGEPGELILNGHLDLDVTDVVPLERSPLVWGMPRQIPGSTTVCFRRRTGLAEVSDEVFALGQLLFPEAQHGSDTFQGKRQTHIRRPDHGALPCSRIKVVPYGILRNAVAGVVKPP